MAIVGPRDALNAYSGVLNELSFSTLHCTVWEPGALLMLFRYATHNKPSGFVRAGEQLDISQLPPAESPS